MSTEPPITTTADLARALLLLDTLPPVERIHRARRLVDVAKSVLSAAGDAATVEACRTQRPAEVARQLGIGRGAVGNALHRHAVRTGTAPAPASTPADPDPARCSSCGHEGHAAFAKCQAYDPPLDVANGPLLGTRELPRCRCTGPEPAQVPEQRAATAAS